MWYPLLTQVNALFVFYFMWYMARIKRFCAYSFTAIYGLIALTFFNLYYFWLTYGYDRRVHVKEFEYFDSIYNLYAGIIVFCAIVLTVIGWLRQR